MSLGTPINQPYPEKPKQNKYKPKDNRDVVLYLKPQAAVKEDDRLATSQASQEVISTGSVLLPTLSNAFVPSNK